MKKGLLTLSITALLLLASCNGEISSSISSSTSGTTEVPTSENTSSSVEDSSSVLLTKTVTFLADGEVVETITFTIGDTSIVEPDVPTKTGYVGSWEDYTLGEQDIVVHAIYKLAGYDVYQGGFRYEDGSLVSSESNSLVSIKDMSFTTGTYSVDMAKNSVGTSDSGIIFGLSHTSDHFWESESGTAYYFFFINVDNNAYLSKITADGESVWNQLGNVVPLENYTNGNTVSLAVSIEDGNINCFVNDKQYIRYHDEAILSGTSVGYRTSGEGTIFDGPQVEEDVKTDPLFAGYNVANGKFALDDNDNLVSTINDSLAVVRNDTWAHGTMETTIVENGDEGDTGIIFGLDQSYQNKFFWEADASYYFAFKTAWGGIYLAKVNNGAWNELKSLSMPDYASMNKNYDLKVEWSEDGTIIVYCNGFERISYQDASPLTGTSYGFRAQKANTVYKDISVSSEITPRPEYTLVNYDLYAGAFDETTENITSKSGGSLVLAKTDAITVGNAYKANITPQVKNDSGIVFAVSTGDNSSFWETEDGVSYYFFFLNVNATLLLAKVDKTMPSVWTTLSYSPILETRFDPLDTYELKAELHEGGLIECYVDGVKVIEYTDSAPLSGSRVGLRAQNPDVVYSSAGIVSNGLGNQPIPEAYTNNHGWTKEIANGYETVTNDNLAVFKTPGATNSFAYAMEEKDVHGDNGVIFALNNPNVTWEDASYYFFFISVNNDAVLAKVDNGWTTLASAPAGDYLTQNSAVSIAINAGRIQVSINEVALIDFTDSAPLLGTYYGLRAQTRKVAFTNIVVA